jgi:hypothetical protein
LSFMKVKELERKVEQLQNELSQLQRDYKECQVLKVLGEHFIDNNGLYDEYMTFLERQVGAAYAQILRKDFKRVK